MCRKMNKAGVHKDQAKYSSDETAWKEKFLEKRDPGPENYADQQQDGQKTEKEN